MPPKVLRTLRMKEHEVKANEGAWWLVRLLPYRTTENVIEGLVLTFIDIDRTKRAEFAALARDFDSSIVATVREPMLILDDTFHVVAANKSVLPVLQTRSCACRA